MKKTLKIIFIVMITILMLLVMITNVSAETTEGTEGGDGTENVEVTEEFYLEDETKTVKLNSIGYLSYKNKPVGESIVWTSADEDIATVENGTVTGKSIGKTTITAKVGEQEDTCEITVEYYRLIISSNESNNASNINLVLGEHPTETLKVKVEDGKYQEVTNAKVTWKSSDAKVATVDANGNVTAVGVGTATITAEAAGVSDTCKVNVAAAPEFTDFSKAKYELLFDIDTDLKISGITPKSDGVISEYNYIITGTNEKPKLVMEKYGALNRKESNAEYLSVNVEENYIYNRDVDKYIELNQDLYLWVIQEVKLDNSYYNGENRISYSTKFVVEGEKLTRPELPQLNLILKTFDISGNWNNENTERDAFTWVNFRFPSATENRKFSIKIGKVTDTAILKKIQNNDYSGITDLQEYAKKDKGVFTTNLTTTRENYYSSDEAFCDGNALFVDDAYYYIYAVFDDENGKYIPIEGVTLGQAHLSDVSDYWTLWAYTSEDFEWNNLESKYEDTENKEQEEAKKEETKKDETVSEKEIPKAGISKVIAIAVMILGVSFVVTYKKYNKYKGI